MLDGQTGTLTSLALRVLELLHEEPRHPYEIHQVLLSREIDRFVKVKTGSLYHTVERLHTLGLIDPVEIEREGRRPERTIYAITDKGEREFHDGIRTVLRHVVPEYPAFGAVVELMRVLPPAEVARLLAERRAELESVIANLENAAETVTQLGLPRLHLVETEYAIIMRRAELSWVRSLISDIQSRRLTWRHPNGPGTGSPIH